MKITLTDARNAAIDGSPVGAFVNAFQESKDPVACQIALETYCDGLISGHAAEVAELTAAHNEALATLTAERDTLLPLVGQLESSTKEKETLAEQVATLAAVQAELAAAKAEATGVYQFQAEAFAEVGPLMQSGTATGEDYAKVLSKYASDYQAGLNRKESERLAAEIPKDEADLAAKKARAAELESATLTPAKK